MIARGQREKLSEPLCAVLYTTVAQNRKNVLLQVNYGIQGLLLGLGFGLSLVFLACF